MPDLSKRRPAYRIALIGLMLSLALVLSLFESMLPALPFLPVGVKLGLSNIVTMYCLFFLGARPAFAVAALKSLFVLLTRGPTGAAMSFAGGILSLAVMLCCRRLFSLGERLTSIAGLSPTMWGSLRGGAAAALCFCFLLPPGDDPFRDPDGNAHRASAAVRYALSAKSG